jgi:hypothetical protein
MTEPTYQQMRLLDVLSKGRGRHAPMAFISVRDPGAVKVFRGGRPDTAFALADVEACADAGWAVFDRRMRRYRITPAGRAKRQEER